MILSRPYLLRLIRIGKARAAGHTWMDGKRYAIVDRLDLCRVDHYLDA